LDNLTHSLVGATLGRMGLKRLSPRAMPALIIAANIPDIDSFVAGAVGCDPLSAHRGFTHGIGGLVTLPFLTVAIIALWQKLSPSKEGPLNLRGLLVASFVGVLSHPLLDLMNSYGTRIAEPFSHRWFYADTLFIVDPWIWIMLILGLELSWRNERLSRNWSRPAIRAFASMLLYIGLNAAISQRSVALTRPLVAEVARPRMIVAGEIPLEFWKRRMIWRSDEIGGTGEYDLLKGLNHASLDPIIFPLDMDDPRLASSTRSSHVRAFLFWSRMPMVVMSSGHAFLTDQRFYEGPGHARNGTFLVPLDNGARNS
jgi:inner membrane protein